MKNRIWSDTENEIIRTHYPTGGVLFTTKVLHAAGFSDRDCLTVMKQASKIKVKRIRKPPKFVWNIDREL